METPEKISWRELKMGLILSSVSGIPSQIVPEWISCVSEYLSGDDLIWCFSEKLLLENFLEEVRNSLGEVNLDLVWKVIGETSQTFEIYARTQKPSQNSEGGISGFNRDYGSLSSSEQEDLAHVYAWVGFCWNLVQNLRQDTSKDFFEKSDVLTYVYQNDSEKILTFLRAIQKIYVIGPSQKIPGRSLILVSDKFLLEEGHLQEYNPGNLENVSYCGSTQVPSGVYLYLDKEWKYAKVRNWSDGNFYLLKIQELFGSTHSCENSSSSSVSSSSVSSSKYHSEKGGDERTHKSKFVATPQLVTTEQPPQKHHTREHQERSQQKIDQIVHDLSQSVEIRPPTNQRKFGEPSLSGMREKGQDEEDTSSMDEDGPFHCSSESGKHWKKRSSSTFSSESEERCRDKKRSHRKEHKEHKEHKEKRRSHRVIGDRTYSQAPKYKHLPEVEYVQRPRRCWRQHQNCPKTIFEYLDEINYKLDLLCEQYY